MGKKDFNVVTKSISSQCQVVVFRWAEEGDIEDLETSELADSIPHDISNYVREVTFSKQMSSPAGQFQISLANDRDWKEHIQIGSWCIIYKSNDDKLNIPKVSSQTDVDFGNGLKGTGISVYDLVDQAPLIRCIGYIDTVRAKGSMQDENGAYDVEYVISGRDYGVIYEETEIWHNIINFDEALLKTSVSKINSSSIKTVDKLLEILHQLIFSPADLVSDLKTDSLTSIARQWLWPTQLFTALGVNLGAKEPFYGNFPDLLQLDESVATFPVESPTALLNGIAWQRLKQYSIEPYHELFVELNNDGLPRLRFRPIPFKVTQGQKFPDVADTIDSFHDPSDPNDQILLETVDILNYDLGRDNHSRYNLFCSIPVTGLVGSSGGYQAIGNNDPDEGFPRVLPNSIRRHGLRLLYSEINALITLGASGGLTEEANPDLVRQFNEVALEYWRNAHYLESGTMEIIGNNDIRIGKSILIDDDAPYNGGKVFYIEGYEEHFFVGEKGETLWTQTLFLTRGLELEKYNKQGTDSFSLFGSADSNPDLSVRSTKYSEPGDFTKG